MHSTAKLRRVVRRSDIHGASITLEIIDAVWDCDPICHGAKVVVVDGIALLSPDASWVLEASDQLFLLGVDTLRVTPAEPGVLPVIIRLV